MKRGYSRIDMEKAYTKVVELLFASLARLVLGLGLGTQACPCVAACSDIFRWYSAYEESVYFVPQHTCQAAKGVGCKPGSAKIV